MNTVSNTDDIIDSRDIIARILELENLTIEEMTDEESNELVALKKLEGEAEVSPDWTYGETLINEDYFVKYTEELIDDCYELPKEITSGDWPYRHITINFADAADELKQDYMEVDFDGTIYLIRA